MRAEDIRAYNKFLQETGATDVKEAEEFVGEKSMYESTLIDYTSIAYINANNTRAIVRALRTDGLAFVDRWLCASEKYTPNMRIECIMPFIDMVLWLGAIRNTLCYGRSIYVARLRNLAGEELATNITAQIIGKKFSLGTPSIDELIPVCNSFFQKIQAAIVPIPIVFRGVTEATSLCGDSVITEAEWYGDCYNKK